jgi:hypothetical protein
VREGCFSHALSLGLWLDRNSCPISALSGLHHCHSQQGVHTDSWEICSGVQYNHDECRDIYRIGYAVRGREPWLDTSTEKDIVLYKQRKLCILWIYCNIHNEFPPISFGTKLRLPDLTARDLGKLQGSTVCTLNTGDTISFTRLKKKLYNLILPGIKLYYGLQV